MTATTVEPTTEPAPPPQERPRRVLDPVVWVAILLTAASATIFFLLRPDQIFLATTPAGGDMGAHVLVPAYIRDSLLPEGRLLGWSNDWYAGFPVLYFYFPLPAFTIVFLDLFLPYGVAFKLVTVAGLVALPFASYYFVRMMGFSRPVSVVGGVAGFTFVFMESYSIFGANALSTLAGEYSFSWSFAFSLVWLGMIVRNVREGRGFTIGAGVVLALTALSHVITTMVVVAASLPLLLKKRGVSTVVGSWLLGFGIAAWWAIPLMMRQSELTTDMGWRPVQGLANVFPRPILALVVLAVVGIVWSVAHRRIIGPALALMAIPVAGYYLIEFFDFTKLYNARLLPYWYYAVFMFAGIAVGLAVLAAIRALGQSRSVGWIAIGVATLGFIGAAAIGTARIPGWARWNYSGYENKQVYDANGVLLEDHAAEYFGLLTALDKLPPGRVMWEANRDMNRYGTPMALMLTGYWSEGHPSMEGLLFESSLTTPFHFLNAAEVSQRPSNPISGLDYHRMDFDRAVRHLALYDVEYYVSFTAEATEAARNYGLDVVAVSEPFTIFRLPPSDLVEVAEYVPAVYSGTEGFFEAALEYYDRVDRLDRWVVAEGPEEWPRITSVRQGFVRPRGDWDGQVSDVVLEDHRISFRTTAVGVPHLIKVSYFPNWNAEGADGPYRAAPSLMVVVPTDEEVVLTFDNTWVENLGLFVTVSTLLGLATWGSIVWRRRRATPGAGRSAPPAEVTSA